jgi:predicted PurR-regulated permease PerM
MPQGASRLAPPARPAHIPVMADQQPTTRTQRKANAIVAVVLVLFGLWLISTFVPALLWAAVIAIAIDPLYTRAERRWPRLQSAVLPGMATLLIAALVLAPLALAVVEAAREAGMALAWVEQARANGLPEPAWLSHLPFQAEVARWWHDNLATPEAAGQQFHRFRSSVLLEKSQLLGRGLIHRSVVFAFTLVALFFLLRDRDLFVAQVDRASARLLGPSGKRLGTQVIRSVRGTIDGLVLVGIGEGAVMAVVYLASGVPHPLLLGMFTAIAAMIPFGAAVLFGIAAVLLVGQGAVGWAIGVFVVGLVVVGIADHFVRPALIGGSTALPFLWVLVGILGGVESLGLLGLFVGPATMAALILLWRDYLARPMPETAVNGPGPT